MEKLVTRVGVGALIINSEGKLLLGLRNVEDNHGLWELLGGLVEGKETLEDAIIREVQEEAGIAIKPNVIIGHNDKYSTDGSIRNVGITFRCAYVSGEPHRTEHERVADFKWLDIDDAFKLNLTPMTKLQIEQYQDWLEIK